MAAQDSDLEKTEPASQHRLDEARKSGDVPRSRELSACISLIVGGALLWMAGTLIQSGLEQMLRDSLSLSRDLAFDPVLLLEHGRHACMRVLAFTLPLAMVVMLAIVMSPVLVGGWVFSTDSLLPKFSRLDPVAGLGRLGSLQSLAELAKAVLKTLLIGSIVWFTLGREQEALFALASLPLRMQVHELADLMMTAFLPMVGALVLIAAIDVPYQRWQHAKKLMMTREQVRQENKEQEGNPEIKARIRAQQREMARRRMMAEVPKADVVVTNPTHYAVALKYTESSNSAPVVIAKGADEVAAKIREIAAAHNVPVLESPPLARALYRHAELGDVIPEKLYTAVAQVLAYVFQLRAGAKPALPGTIEVPAEMEVPLGG